MHEVINSILQSICCMVNYELLLSKHFSYIANMLVKNADLHLCSTLTTPFNQLMNPFSAHCLVRYLGKWAHIQIEH